MRRFRDIVFDLLLFVMLIPSLFSKDTMAQVTFGPSYSQPNLNGGVILGPTYYPSYVDTLNVTATMSTAFPVTITYTNVLMTSPTRTGPWTACTTLSSEMLSIGGLTQSGSCTPQGSGYYEVIAQTIPYVVPLYNYGSNTVSLNLSSPRGVAFTQQIAATHYPVNAQNVLAISDSGNNRVLTVTPYGSPNNYATYALSTDLSNPGQLAYDLNGNLYICDTGNNRIRVVNAGTGVESTLATSVTLNAPDGIAISTGGAIYVANTGANTIVKGTTSGLTATIATTGATLSAPHGLTLDTSGNLMIANTGGNDLLELASPTTGTTLTVLPSGAAAYNGLTGVGGSGCAGTGCSNFQIYVSDSGNNKVYNYNGVAGYTAPAIVNTYNGTNVSNPSQVSSTTGLTGTTYPIFIADTGNNRILSVPYQATQFSIASVYESAGVYGTSSLYSFCLTTGCNINGNLEALHFSGYGSSVTNSVFSACAGTGATLTTAGTDLAGEIILTTGTSPSASCNLLDVIFSTAYAAYPHVFLTPDSNAAYLTGIKNAAALYGSQQVYNIANESYFLLYANTTALAASTQYAWNYFVVTPLL